jgi:hypothetical protein
MLKGDESHFTPRCSRLFLFNEPKMDSAIGGMYPVCGFRMGHYLHHPNLKALNHFNLAKIKST